MDGNSVVIADHPARHSNRRGGNVFVVDFHCEGNSAAYRTSGWSGQEESYVWSLESGCELRLPAQDERLPLTIEIDFAIPAAGSSLKAAVVRVLVNRHPVGSASVSGWTRLRCEVSADLIVPGETLDVGIEHPCFVRPDFFDHGREDRLLGLCFYALRVYPPWMKKSLENFAPKPPDGRLVEACPPSPVAEDQPAGSVLYRFNEADPAASMLLQGWWHDRNGDAWASARECSLDIPAPDRPGLYMARFSLSPLYIRDVILRQRITILLSGAVIGQFRTGTDISLAVPLPPELYQVGGVLKFSFALPDGQAMHVFDPSLPRRFVSLLLEALEIAPMPAAHAGYRVCRCDDVATLVPIATSEQFLDDPVDQLPDAVKAVVGVDLSQMLQAFESLGDNCGFGLAQRKAGCEVLGLLRFANTPIKSLMLALDHEFQATADPAELTIGLPDNETGEYCLFADRYGIRWHTNVYGGSETPEAEIFAQQSMRLGYLRRKFYETLRGGRKILTIARAEPRKHPVALPFAGEPAFWEERPECLRFAEVLPLFAKLNEYGANTVLYLTRCGHGRRSGTVELLAPGLMRGYLDDFVIRPEAEHRDHAAWLRVAANAWLLDQGPNASFHRKPAS